MARIQEEVIVITVSKLHKNDPNATQTDSRIVTDDNVAALTQVAEELIGNGVVVEVARA